MALTLPNTSVLNRQLSKAGLAAKASGPSLFSPLQSPGPTAPQRTSMMALDRYQSAMPAKPPGLFDERQSLPGSLSWAKPEMDVLGVKPSNPYYTPPGLGTSGGSPGSVGAFSGDQSMLNTYDAAFQAAGARYGIDPNWIKSIAAIEGHYDNSVDQYGAVGIMGIMPGGYPALEAMYPGWQSDPGQNIALGAAILAEKIRANGGTIEGGIQGYLGWGTDAYGTTPGSYLQRAQQYYNQLSQNGGQFGSVSPINGMWGGNPTGNAFVQAALQYQGVDYNWGAIPGANQDPWQTGWDCSGFTYFMDQKYGNGSLPMGSHYQYQYAQTTGQLFTDLSQLQPGDLVFIDTGWQGGAGAELNRAGHVGIYIGNGQMIHAANENVGTIISPLSGYGGILGAMHQGGSGGAAGGGGYYGGSTGQGSSLNQRIQSFLGSYR